MASRRNGRSLAVAAILMSAAHLLIGTVHCQAGTDSDDQFQYYHQDIGRISGASSNSPVAPQTIVRQYSAPPVTPVAPAPASPPQVFERTTPSRTIARNPSQQQASRKPNRITLAVRTHAPIQVSPVTEPAASQPELAPQQQHHHHQQQQHSHMFQQSAPLPQHQFQPLPVPVAQPAFQLPAPESQPALSSFRASAGHSQSVSARHTALMAQVAAERQAQVGAGEAPALQPSLGSPLEALSSPSVAQVQPPPTLLSQQPPTAAASPAFSFVNQPEEPLVAPSFEHVVSKGCPHKGVFSYENKDHCDRYYMCTNGTFTEEACPNGLAYSQMGAVYQHCAYNWNVECGRKKTSEPLASPGCPWQFGIFPVSSAGRCSIDYFVCEWGVPETKRCSPEGLFYDDRIKGCQWADQLGCKSEALLNFKCPPEDEDNPYWPYPRYYHNKQDVIVCVNEQPRLVHCNEDQMVDPSSLACLDLKKNKRKKF